MSQYIINNNGPLSGEIRIGGAKNSALPIIVAALLTEENCTIYDVPEIDDVFNLLEAIRYLGADFEFKNNTLVFKSTNINPKIPLNYDCISKIRASYYLLGMLLGRFNEANISLPGGCKIGTRPMDIHFKGLRALGANISVKKGNIIAKANNIKGANIFLDFASVGATINIILASVFCEGVTIITNAAKEPHVVDVVNFLNRIGARIKGAGTSTIRITGVKKLHSIDYTIIPDQIEAGTFMVAAAVTKGDIILRNVISRHLDCISLKLTEMGANIYAEDDLIRISCNKRLKSTIIRTGPYPMFPTDMQAQFAVACGLAEGTSLISENIFENRFLYTSELNRMGAKMKVFNRCNVIEGIEKYQGTKVCCPDLRAGAALTLAALTADDEVIINDIDYIQRGYENFDLKLKALGADIIIK